MDLQSLMYQNSMERAIQTQRVDQMNKDLKFKNTLGQGEFLKIFVAQLKAQNPLEPVKDKEFISQMAQFSSLEQIGSLNKKMDLFLKKGIDNDYYQLIGKKVECLDSFSKEVYTGRVEAVEKKTEGFFLRVDGRLFKKEDLLKVSG